MEQERKIRVICIGDSITEGYGLGDDPSVYYPSVLQELLGEDYEVFNLRTPLPLIFEQVSMVQMNKQPNICVDIIDVIGVSSSSTLVIGNVDHTQLSSRILNIRRLVERDDVKKGG